MGHLSNHGFSSQLMLKIAECRTKVEEWVEREKQAADDMEQKFLASLSQEQSTIDGLEEDLLSVNFKLGMAINDKGNTGADGVVQQQENLMEEKEQLQATISELKMDMATKNGIVKRKLWFA